MSEEMTTADVLDAAADYLRSFGHFKGDFCDRTMLSNKPPCCILGALSCVKTGEPIPSNIIHSNEYKAIVGHLGLDPDEWTSLSVWNDRPERTADEVIDALMSCAADLRLRGEP